MYNTNWCDVRHLFVGNSAEAFSWLSKPLYLDAAPNCDKHIKRIVVCAVAPELVDEDLSLSVYANGNGPKFLLSHLGSPVYKGDAQKVSQIPGTPSGTVEFTGVWSPNENLYVTIYDRDGNTVDYSSISTVSEKQPTVAAAALALAWNVGHYISATAVGATVIWNVVGITDASTALVDVAELANATVRHDYTSSEVRRYLEWSPQVDGRMFQLYLSSTGASPIRVDWLMVDYVTHPHAPP